MSSGSVPGKENLRGPVQIALKCLSLQCNQSPSQFLSDLTEWTSRQIVCASSLSWKFVGFGALGLAKKLFVCGRKSSPAAKVQACEHSVA